MSAETDDQLFRIKSFLLARLADREQHVRERWDGESGPVALLLIASQRAIVNAWADPMGQWTADQADAAAAQKLLMLRRMAEEY